MNGSKIPFTGTQRQYKNLRSELLATADAIWSKGQHLDGAQTLKLEEALAYRCGREYAVAVNSGTQALIFAMRSLQLPWRSRILIPGVSFVATLNSIYEANNIPYIVDTDSQGLLDLTTLQDQFGVYQVNAIMPVNLYGNMVDFEKIQLVTEFFGGDRIPIIEDAAQSLGAYYKRRPSGSFGDVSILSFDPMKNLNNYGSGGMLLTNDEEVYLRAKDLRSNGKISNHTLSGTNSKISELDAATLLIKLDHFDDWQRRRTQIAEYYQERLRPYVRVLEIGANVEASWHKFPIFLHHRDSLKDHLTECGIETKVHYEYTLGSIPLYNRVSNNIFSPEYIDYEPFFGQNSTEVCDTTLSLPIYPELTDEEIKYIADSVIEFF